MRPGRITTRSGVLTTRFGDRCAIRTTGAVASVELASIKIKDRPPPGLAAGVLASLRAAPPRYGAFTTIMGSSQSYADDSASHYAEEATTLASQELEPRDRAMV